MEEAVRTVNMLSAVIMLAAGIYLLACFWFVLSPFAQGLVGVAVLLYFFVQIELNSRCETSDPKGTRMRKSV